MRVTSCKNTLSVSAEVGDSQELVSIATRLMPEWLHLFARKNRDYGDNAQELGLRGQFADIWRKIAKLKKSMWDGEELIFEGTEEVLMDLIGHLFLSLNMLRLRDDAERMYAYTEDDAAVDAFFRMVGNDPRSALAACLVLNPPFRELVSERAQKEIAADQAETMERIADAMLSEAQGLTPPSFVRTAAQRATEAAAAAQGEASEARYEACDTPVGGDFWQDAFKVGALRLVEDEPVQFPFAEHIRSVAERAAAVDGPKAKRDVFDEIARGMQEPKQEMSLAEWLYRRYGRGITDWSDLPDNFQKLWEIEAEAGAKIARRG